MLDVLNLSCGYDNTDIVKNMSFSLSRHEILSITGPNGCGKTTLLRALSGIIPYNSGSIKISGEEIKNLSRRKLSQKIALLSQTGASGEYSDFTVLETVMLGRYARSSYGTQKHDLEIAESCLEQTGIANLSDRFITELSGGQLQRVFLARAFAQEPDIILLDEPSNHLDLKHRLILIDLLQKYASSGHGVIGIFHDLNLAAALSDRIMLMNDGQNILCDNSETVCKSSLLSEIYGFDVRKYMHDSLEKWK